jgi:hypothetical protein
MNDVLTLRNLWAGYDHEVVLEDINLSGVMHVPHPRHKRRCTCMGMSFSHFLLRSYR